MSDIIEDLVAARLRGLAPPPSWSQRAEDEISRLRAKVAELEAIVQRSARIMHGDGVEDQGEAWDKVSRLLDGASDAIAAQRGAEDKHD